MRWPQWTSPTPTQDAAVALESWMGLSSKNLQVSFLTGTWTHVLWFFIQFSTPHNTGSVRTFPSPCSVPQNTFLFFHSRIISLFTSRKFLEKVQLPCALMIFPYPFRQIPLLLTFNTDWRSPGFLLACCLAFSSCPSWWNEQRETVCSSAYQSNRSLPQSAAIIIGAALAMWKISELELSFTPKNISWLKQQLHECKERSHLQFFWGTTD